MKCNYKDPYSDPGYKARKEAGERLFKKMKFSDEREKREYLKAVESNPNNVVGMPVLFPPMKIQSSLCDVEPMRDCECGGNAIAREHFICYKCGNYVKPKQ